jgi:hypothetical protein
VVIASVAIIAGLFFLLVPVQELPLGSGSISRGSPFLIEVKSDPLLLATSVGIQVSWGHSFSMCNGPENCPGGTPPRWAVTAMDCGNHPCINESSYPIIGTTSYQYNGVFGFTATPGHFYSFTVNQSVIPGADNETFPIPIQVSEIIPAADGWVGLALALAGSGGLVYTVVWGREST